MDAENWISHMEKIFDVMGFEDAFKTRLVIYKFEGNARPRVVMPGWSRAAAGTEEEQAENFQWGLRRQRSGDRHQPTSQQSSHRNHGHNNDRHSVYAI
nr:zinc finger, CCHC-type, retrotransposon Gag domain protein [Tanacetum cinerariifolium]